MEVWNHFHTFLSLGRGDCEDHAILLCSLLLGFGLDAYVCVGAVRESTGATRDHVWVITRSRRGSSSSSSRTRVVFWETLTGQRYPHRLLSTGGSSSGGGGNGGGGGGGGGGGPDADTTPQYQTIGCAFNHRTFYANRQSNDSVPLCNFTFEDERCWKGMDPEIMVGLEHQERVPL